MKAESYTSELCVERAMSRYLLIVHEMKLWNIKDNIQLLCVCSNNAESHAKPHQRAYLKPHKRAYTKPHKRAYTKPHNLIYPCEF